MSDCSVLLVSMPWQSVKVPSIQLGTLKALMDRHEITAECRSYSLVFKEFLDSLPPQYRLSFDDYDEISDVHHFVGLGDWMFAIPPFRALNAVWDQSYVELLRARSVSEEMIQKVLFVRSAVPMFLQRCVDDIRKLGPRVVGFSSMFSQNAASLNLAMLLKAVEPAIKIVFGGANCQADMGAALIRSFPCVDAVVRGEAESVFPELVKEWLSDRPVTSAPGLCYRNESSELVIDDSLDGMVDMETVPTPDYDEYFSLLNSLSGFEEIKRDVKIPIEAARGCWWGQKSHCTFCGLNGSTMTFRSKPASAVFDEIMTLARKHRKFDFFAVDNILDMHYFDELLPKLRDARVDLSFFFETKANLKKHQLQMMRDAGIRSLQPGIESFSNPILKLIRKGTTALQNIQLLKWSSQFGIEVYWNVIYGFPGEPPEEYERMAELMKLLTHLRPPQLVPLNIDRFSPYHTSPTEHGLENIQPAPYYKFIYDLEPAELANIAYSFVAEHTDGRDPESYVGQCRSVIATWNESWPDSLGSLSYQAGPGFLTISDRRPHFSASERVLDELEAAIYLACDAGSTPVGIHKILEHGDFANDTRVEDVQRILDELTEAKLMYAEDGRYLALALRANANEIIPELEASKHLNKVSLPNRLPVGIRQKHRRFSEPLATESKNERLVQLRVGKGSV